MNLSPKHVSVSHEGAKRALVTFLDESFEKLKACRHRRTLVLAAATMAGFTNDELAPTCERGDRCRSGCCPICIRMLRRRLLRFFIDERLYERNWLFVTAFVEGWTKAPGDASNFGDLGSNKVIERFLRRLQRDVEPGLMVIGSIETEYLLIADEAKGKPYHLHLLVSGASEASILAAGRSLPPEQGVVVPIKVKQVDARPEQLISTLGYCFKQTWWRKWKASVKAKGQRQWPSRKQLAELMSSMGVHGFNGRLVLRGLRCDRGHFRLTR